MIRALWLHYPDDPRAVARGDEYLFGRDLLVAPVVEKGATSRSLYLPRGTWFDFWTHERQKEDASCTESRSRRFAALRARGSGAADRPPRQYTTEPADGPLTMTVFPGAGGVSLLYQDDGESFDFRNGEFMRIEMQWDDAARKLAIRLASGARMLRAKPMTFRSRWLIPIKPRRLRSRAIRCQSHCDSLLDCLSARNKLCFFQKTSASACASRLHPDSQFAALHLCLENLRFDGWIVLCLAGVYIKGIAMPWTNHPPIFNCSFAEWPAFMRTSSIEHANRPVNIGDAQHSTFYGNFENQPALGQFGLSTDTHIFSHLNFSH